MAGLVYILCALTSLSCAVLLWRGYRQSQVRLLLWSGLCFAGFTISNVLLYIDLKVLTAVDLSIARSLPTFIGLALLLYGLIWDAEE